VRILKALREDLLSHGAEFRFGTTVSDLHMGSDGQSGMSHTCQIFLISQPPCSMKI
jgi:uncharacterized FAD-dependent dehydrogenase